MPHSDIVSEAIFTANRLLSQLFYVWTILLANIQGKGSAFI